MTSTTEDTPSTGTTTASAVVGEVRRPEDDTKARRLITQSFVSGSAAAVEGLWIPMWVGIATMSSTAIFAVIAARVLPGLFASPFFGALSDRRDAGRLLSLLIAVGGALLMLSTAVLYLAGRIPEKPFTNPFFLFFLLLMVMRSCCKGAEAAVRASALSHLTSDERLLQRMATIELALGVSKVLTPGLSVVAGMLYNTTDIMNLAITMAIVALIQFAAGFIFAGPVGVFEPDTIGVAPARSRSAWRATWSQIQQDSRLGAQFLLLAGVLVFVRPFSTVVPYTTKAEFPRQTSDIILWSSTATAVGIVLGSLIAVLLRQRNPAQLAMIFAVVSSFPTLIFGAYGRYSFLVSFLIIVVMVASTTIFSIANATEILRRARPGSKGAVMGVFYVNAVIYTLVVTILSQPTVREVPAANLLKLMVAGAIINVLICAIAIVRLSQKRERQAGAA